MSVMPLIPSWQNVTKEDYEALVEYVEKLERSRDSWAEGFDKLSEAHIALQKILKEVLDK